VYTRPIRERGARDDQRAEQLGPQRGENHDRPASLAVADHARLAVGIRMPLDHFLDEDRFSAGDTFDGLSRHGLGKEPDEVAGMSCLHGHADLTVGLEAADTGTVTGARVDHDERPAIEVDLHSLGRNDADQRIVDGLFQLAAVDDQFRRVAQHMRRGLRDMLAVLITPLAEDIQEQHGALPRIDHIFDGLGDEARHGAARNCRIFSHDV
jgi:hypothetical protein